LDLAYVDEAGFAMSLPTTTTWGAVGCPRLVPYEAPQGRRLNAIAGYFSHGPQAGDFQFDTFARIPDLAKLLQGTSGPPLAEAAAKHGLTAEDLGIIDGEVFVGFIWQLAGRPPEAPPGWKRERPLKVVLDNYSVHKGERVRLERRALEAAGVSLVYLPAYAPELSRIETHWKTAKYHDLRKRSYQSLRELKTAVETALTKRRMELRQRHAETAQ
jgi:putative transposase